MAVLTDNLQCKVFSNSSAGWLEEEINDWIKENPGYIIANVQVTGNKYQSTVIIFYTF